MKDILIIDYTELDFPLDGFKYNEGHVILESLKKSKLEHLVVSTGNNHGEDSLTHLKRRKSMKDQGDIAERLLNAKVISPGSKQDTFDYSSNWFAPGVLEGFAQNYKNIIINFHSIDPRNLHITKNLKNIPENIKLVYTVHESRGELPLHNSTGNFSEFSYLMHDYISFSEPISEELSILDKAKHIKIGVDPNEFPLLTKENNGLVIATNSYLNLAQYDPLNLSVLTHILLKVQDLRVNLDVSNRNTKCINNIKELDFYKDRLKIFNNNYGLTDEGNPFIDVDLFFSHYKRKVIDVTVLKALMSGVPIISPFSEYYTDVLSSNNSISYIDEAGDFTSRPRNFGGDLAFKDARKVVYEFMQDKLKFDRLKIRQDIIKKGHTADLMVAKLDDFYLELPQK